MSSFDLWQTVAASTKRPPTVASGLRGAPATNITSLACFPLDPLDPELARRRGLETPTKYLQTMVDGSLDIIEGDILVVGSDEYPIKGLEKWTWFPDGVTADYRLLILEDLKR